MNTLESVLEEPTCYYRHFLKTRTSHFVSCTWIFIELILLKYSYFSRFLPKDFSMPYDYPIRSSY